jgi:predicted phage terminase large subunit-like protein
MFKREWFSTYFTDPPDDIEMAIRFWDKAATKKKSTSRRDGPDYTAGVLIGRRKAGAFPRYVVLDAVWVQEDPGGVEQLIRETAARDGRETLVRWEEEPGASGKGDTFNYVTKVLVGYDCAGVRASGSKELRAGVFSAQCKVGNIGLVRSWWNNGYLNFLTAFPSETVHDDPVDASTGAFNEIYLNDGDAPYAIASSKPQHNLPKTYEPEKDEMEDEERERLMRRQQQLGRFLQDIGRLHR